MAKSNYAVQLAKFAQKAADITDRVVRGVVMEIGTRIVDRSPVGDGTLWKSPPPKGYIGGRFRANWQYGNYSGAGIPMADLPNIDKSGAASIARIAAGLPQKAAGMKHVLINNLPYAQALEDGHSTQAPSGMVGLVALEFPQIVRDVVASEKGA
jgi:hypothetical protein